MALRKRYNLEVKREKETITFKIITFRINILTLYLFTFLRDTY